MCYYTFELDAPNENLCDIIASFEKIAIIDHRLGCHKHPIYVKRSLKVYSKIWRGRRVCLDDIKMFANYEVSRMVLLKRRYCVGCTPGFAGNTEEMNGHVFQYCEEQNDRRSMSKPLRHLMPMIKRNSPIPPFLLPCLQHWWPFR